MLCCGFWWSGLTAFFFWQVFSCEKSRRCDDHQQITVSHFSEHKRLHLRNPNKTSTFFLLRAIIKAICIHSCYIALLLLLSALGWVRGWIGVPCPKNRFTGLSWQTCRSFFTCLWVLLVFPLSPVGFRRRGGDPKCCKDAHATCSEIPSQEIEITTKSGDFSWSWLSIASSAWYHP